MREEILTRGVEKIYPSTEALTERLRLGQPLKVYWGIDPTGPDLHLGHLVPLLKLRDLAEAGHETLIVVGDFTAMIGDPTDKKATRQQLTVGEVKENLKGYKKQLARIIDLAKVKIVFNSKWLAKLKFAEVLELASEFTVAQMLERDMFEKRFKAGEPIHLHEFFYPLMQGYDSVALGVDLEIGGNDQTFNMLAGRTLLKRAGKEKFVLTTKLLVDNNGKKMGKTEGNLATFSDSPENMYGQIMSWGDELIPSSFELLTRLPDEEVKNILAGHPKEAKMCLASEIVKLVYGEAKAKRAARDFQTKFSDGAMPAELPATQVAVGELLVDILLREKIVESKSDFRRLLDAGAIKELTGNKITASDYCLSGDLDLQIGKKRFLKLRV